MCYAFLELFHLFFLFLFLLVLFSLISIFSFILVYFIITNQTIDLAFERIGY